MVDGAVEEDNEICEKESSEKVNHHSEWRTVKGGTKKGIKRNYSNNANKKNYHEVLSSDDDEEDEDNQVKMGIKIDVICCQKRMKMKIM